MNNINGMVSKSSTVKLPSVSVSSIDLNTSTVVPTSQETWFTGRNMITLGLLLLILALLGMNIFSYLGEGVDIFGSILQKFGIGTAKAAQDTVDVSMDGVKLGADIAAGSVKDAANFTLLGKIINIFILLLILQIIPVMSLIWIILSFLSSINF